MKAVMETMATNLSKEDCLDLSHTICNSFYHGREDEFEIIKNDNVPKNIDSVMLIYDTYLAALLCYNILNKNNDTSLVTRDVCWTIKGEDKKNYEQEWIIITDCDKTL